ncbi:E3 ufm1-protein ligase 1-like protein [Thalictrum thalictroides]|uniref:E3 ufm1-protein ligase 1-like protein n=1 Tax=Thalictrum thalictroides TaxID=46969 RepID=A0A7J6X5W5_THATH|nr:E3 ufm1-protein ligase 1-like protein [Thalictrum thalictroides]
MSLIEGEEKSEFLRQTVTERNFSNSQYQDCVKPIGNIEKIEDAAYKILIDYHTATVALLALLSTATDDEKDCTSDRIMSKREFLESLMPNLKGLVTGVMQS